MPSNYQSKREKISNYIKNYLLNCDTEIDKQFFTADLCLMFGVEEKLVNEILNFFERTDRINLMGNTITKKGYQYKLKIENNEDTTKDKDIDIDKEMESIIKSKPNSNSKPSNLTKPNSKLKSKPKLTKPIES